MSSRFSRMFQIFRLTFVNGINICKGVQRHFLLFLATASCDQTRWTKWHFSLLLRVFPFYWILVVFRQSADQHFPQLTSYYRFADGIHDRCICISWDATQCCWRYDNYYTSVRALIHWALIDIITWDYNACRQVHKTISATWSNDVTVQAGAQND